MMNGNYAVIVTETNCTDTSACYPVTTVGIDAIVQNALRIYPNPAASEVSVQINVTAAQSAEITFFNAAGQLAASEQVSLSAGSNAKAFNLEQLAKGVYQVRIKTNEQVIIRKLILN